jgi:uncharacterized protein (TIGR03083 family)
MHPFYTHAGPAAVWQSARMLDDRELDGLDPYDLMERETARLDGYFATLDGDAWKVPSACAAWSVRDVLAHLAGSEEYNHACLDDAVVALMERYGALGATDLESFNAVGVAQRRDRPPVEVVGEWRAAVARTIDGLRALDGGDVPTSVGPYPARWQAFHLAAELATHADDVGVPVSVTEAASRTAWRARVARFMEAEAKPDVELVPDSGGTRVTADGVTAVLSDAELVAAVNGRVAADASIDPRLSASLNLLA